MLQILQIFVIFCYQHFSSQATPIFGFNVKLAEENQFPFVASLSINNSDHSFLCGGTLITRRHILTAAHCLRNVRTYNDIVVKLGSVDLKRAQTYSVKSWKTYDDWANSEYSERSKHDIAIIKLVNKVNSSIEPAVITNLPSSKLYYKKAVTAGWGRSETDESSKRMRFAEVDVLTQKECPQNPMEYDEIQNRYVLVEKFLCTKAQPVILLECGDSGGPLLINGKEMIGVNKGICGINRGGIILKNQNLHASLPFYKKFICDVTEKQSSMCKCLFRIKPIG